MTRISTLLVILIGFSNSLSQNLIINPGFENGMEGWHEFWTRNPNSGITEIVNSPVHAGNNSLHIEHWGLEDWSLAPRKLYPTKPGYVYEYSAWVNVNKLPGWAQLNVVIMDSTQETISFFHVRKDFNTTIGTFEQVEVRFIIPDSVYYFWPKIIGADSCDLVVDDIYLALIDSSTNSIEDTYLLENDTLKVQVVVPDFKFDIIDKTNNIVYTTSESNFLRVTEVDTLEHGYLFHCDYLIDGFSMAVGIKLSKNTIYFELIADSSASMSNSFQFPGFIRSNHNDYFIIPYASGLILPTSEPLPFLKFPMWEYKSTMAFVGITNQTSGFLITSDAPWDTEIHFSQPFNHEYRTIHQYHIPSKSKFGYSRKFYYTFVTDGGYVEMCEWYRNHVEELGHIKTFQEKISENPNTEKLLGAVDFWVQELFFSVDNKTTFLDTLQYFGLDKAIISLEGGWGVNDGNSELIERINKKGFLSSRYDLYTDVWPSSPSGLNLRTEGYPADVIVKEDGSLQEGFAWPLSDGSTFQGYYTCSTTHAQYAQTWLPEDLQKNHYNCRFIDVELASRLFECYAPAHPIPRQNDAISRTKLMELIKNEYGLVTGAEDGKDFAFKTVDYGEGIMSINAADPNWFIPNESPPEEYISLNMNPAVRVPLHGLVYHDIHVATWWTGDGVSKVPPYWDSKDLFNILYASMPLFYPPYSQGNEYWYTNLERFLTSYHLVSSVFRSAGFARMENHKMLSSDWNVQKTEFSNGWYVVANFGSNDFQFESVTIPSMGFYATDGQFEVSKVSNGQNTVAIAKLIDRLFVNPFGVETEIEGVSSSGSIFLQKYSDHVHLAFIGEQNSVKLKPELLPWNISTTKIYTRDKSVEIQPEFLDNGWIKLDRLPNQRFYYIEIDSSITSVAQPEDELAEDTYFDVYPNPFNSSTTVALNIAKDSNVKLELFNLLGQRVRIILDKKLEAGKHTINIDSNKVASGLYIIRFRTEDMVLAKKIILNK